MSKRVTDRTSPRPSTLVSESGALKQTRAVSASTAQNEAQTGAAAVTAPSTVPTQRHGLELPPLPQALSSAVMTLSPPASRAIGFSSILNPIKGDESRHGRRRKAAELDSPAESARAASLAGEAAGQSLVQYATGPSATEPYRTSERQARRILTPRSPLQRAASLSQLQPSTGAVSAQQAPFPPSPRPRVYTIEPGTSVAPPLPTPPAALRPGNSLNAYSPPIEAARRASAGGTRFSGAPSLSASPSTSYSSYSQAGQTPPSAQYAPLVNAGLAASYSTAQESATGVAGSMATTSMLHERQRAVSIPMSSSSGPNVYKMMTLETTSGTVQLPVDVQAASRVADEKRRRNAGASARFRQRRKEKEKEAATTISRLEQQVKELADGLDFYKRERDYLAGVVLQVPGGERHFPRPASPRPRRSSPATAGPSGTTGRTYAASQEPPLRSPEADRSVRRRTSTMSLPQIPLPPPLQQIPPPGPAFPEGFVPQYGGPMATQQPPPLQTAPRPISPLTSTSNVPVQVPGSLSQRQPLPGPMQLMQTDPRPGPWNPYGPGRASQGPPGLHHERR